MAFEREAELVQLGSACERASQGEGACILLEGPAGIGKTRLLEEARELAGAHGLRRLSARGGELERDFAYGIVRQLFEPAVRNISGADRDELLAGAAGLAGPALGLAEDGEVPGDGGAGDSFASVHGLYWLTANLAAQGPLLLEVDDCHWADAPSLRYLMFLLGRLEGLPLLVLLASRPNEPLDDKHLISRLGADSAATVLRPDPLSIRGVTDLIEARSGSEPAPEFAAACLNSTGGNPFFLGELLEALAADAIEPNSAEAAHVHELGPETISRSLMLRLALLPAASARIAQAVAVLGAEAQPAHAAALAGVEPEPAGEASDALAAVSILAAERPLRFQHPVMREAIYADIPPSKRAEMHARSALILRETGSPPAIQAPHLLATDPAGDDEVVRLLSAAASQALQQGAPDLAQRYLRRALDEPPEDDSLAAILEELGTAEALVAEEPASAIEHLQASLELGGEPRERARRAVTLSRTMLAAGDLPRSVAVLERELEGDARLDRETTLRIEAELASFATQNPETQPVVRKRIARYAQVAGETVPELMILVILSVLKWIDGESGEGTALARRALEGGRMVAQEGGDCMSVYQATWVLTFSDHHEEALAVLDEALDDARRRGSAFGVTMSCGVRTVIAWRRGDVKAMEAEARNAIELGQKMAPYGTPPIYALLALALIETGNLEEAEEAIAMSGCGPHLPEMESMNLAFYGRGRLRLAQGRHEEALADFTELGARDLRLLGVGNNAKPWRSGAAEANFLLGRIDEARRLSSEQLGIAERFGVGSALGIAWHTEGIVGERPLEALAKAVEVLAGSPARLDHARALVDLGAAIRRDGKRAKARDPLKEGLEAARRCGSTVLVERAHAELVAAGARPRRLMFSGLESLTASERRVCEMVATGQSNREVAQSLFVTSKTVQNHLSRAYSKLSISSRDDLAEALSGDSREA